MKKSVALVIGLLVVVGVALVTFFGTMPANIYPPVYIQTIELLDMYGNPIEETNGRKILRLEFEPDLFDEENDLEYMQYFFTVSLNKGLEQPTNESVLYSFDEKIDSADNLPLVSPANGDYSSGALLIKEKTNPQTIQDYFLAMTITVRSNDGGIPVSDSCQLIIDFGYEA